MNKFDYILYIECKLLFIDYWLCYILLKKKNNNNNNNNNNNKRVYINLATKLNR